MRRHNRRNENKTSNEDYSKYQREFIRSVTQPQEEHQAKCAKCGQMCTVPFKPREGKPVYCRGCFAEMRRQQQ